MTRRRGWRKDPFFSLYFSFLLFLALLQLFILFLFLHVYFVNSFPCQLFPLLALFVRFSRSALACASSCSFVPSHSFPTLLCISFLMCVFRRLLFPSRPLSLPVPSCYLFYLIYPLILSNLSFLESLFAEFPCNLQPVFAPLLFRPFFRSDSAPFALLHNRPSSTVLARPGPQHLLSGPAARRFQHQRCVDKSSRSFSFSRTPCCAFPASFLPLSLSAFLPFYLGACLPFAFLPLSPIQPPPSLLPHEHFSVLQRAIPVACSFLFA